MYLHNGSSKDYFTQRVRGCEAARDEWGASFWTRVWYRGTHIRTEAAQEARHRGAVGLSQERVFYSPQREQQHSQECQWLLTLKLPLTKSQFLNRIQNTSFQWEERVLSLKMNKVWKATGGNGTLDCYWLTSARATMSVRGIRLSCKKHVRVCTRTHICARIIY